MSTDKGANNGYSDYIKGKDEVEDDELTKGWGQIATPLLLETAGGKQNVKGTRQIVIKKAHVPFFCLYWGTIYTPLSLKALDGKMRKTNCANTEGIFRIDKRYQANND